MKLLMERWNNYLQEEEDMERVSKAVIFDGDGKILILKRAPKLITKDVPWGWDLPGGHIEKGEKDIQAMAREVKEETGLAIIRAPDWYMLEKETRFFLIEEWSGKVSLSEEHAEYEWIDPKEAKNYDLGKKYLGAIAEASRQIKGENE
jgi:8-oxo-dGTP pyrophosphatase MutT (NUDIX family)